MGYDCWSVISVGEFLRNACVELRVHPEYSPRNEITNVAFYHCSEMFTTSVLDQLSSHTCRFLQLKDYGLSLAKAGIANGSYLVLIAPEILKSDGDSEPANQDPGGSMTSKGELLQDAEKDVKSGENLVGQNSAEEKLRDKFAEKKDPHKKMSEKEAMEKYMPILDEILSKPGQTTLEASEVLPFLFIGGKPAANDCLDGKNTQYFTHMLNCAEPWCPMGNGPDADGIKYAGFRAIDHASYDMLGNHYPDDCRDIIDEAKRAFMEASQAKKEERRRRGRILVNCAMGVNRSGVIVAAYLIDREEMKLVQAVELLKEARGCVLTNKGFREGLIKFALKKGRLD